MFNKLLTGTLIALSLVAIGHYATINDNNTVLIFLLTCVIGLLLHKDERKKKEM